MPRSVREYVSVGEQHGRLTILEMLPPRNGVAYVLAHCVCGRVKPICARSIARQASLSCGCLRSDLMRLARCLPYREERSIWNMMKARCFNKRNSHFKHYGARGITVCREWNESFAEFLFDMGPRPSSDHSLDRIDNDGPYAPTNCRWATRLEQANNKRNTAFVTYRGHRCPVADLARTFGIENSTLHGRLGSGWDVEAAVCTPVRRRATGPVRISP